MLSSYWNSLEAELPICIMQWATWIPRQTLPLEIHIVKKSICKISERSFFISWSYEAMNRFFKNKTGSSICGDYYDIIGLPVVCHPLHHIPRYGSIKQHNYACSKCRYPANLWVMFEKIFSRLLSTMTVYHLDLANPKCTCVLSSCQAQRPDYNH